jgi:ParB-like chromosome segregation protein Spo0J
MITTTPVPEPRDQVALAQIDQRYAILRLVEPNELQRIRASIERMGVLHPVLIATAVDGDRLVLVDGFKRMRIATDRGDATVWVRRSAMDATAAKVAMIATNAGRRGLADVEEAWIVRSLCRDHALTQAEVGKALRRDKSWVCRRLMLAERLEASLQDDIRLGLLSSTAARELARLPRGNQVAMATAIRAHGLTSRQAYRVVTELLHTRDPAARAEVLADPLRYLGGVEPPAVRAHDPRLGKRANELRESLLTVAGTSDRCTRAVTRCAPAGLVGDEARILAPIAERTLRSAREVVAVIAQLVQDHGAP